MFSRGAADRYLVHEIGRKWKQLTECVAHLCKD
jgi:hypothetical protein